MDLKSFYLSIEENVKLSQEQNGTSYEEEYLKEIIDYMTQSGEASAPTLCFFAKTKSRLSAYDYDYETGSLDLFLFIRATSPCGHIDKRRLDKGFNQLRSFYRESMEGTILRTVVGASNNDEIVEVSKVVKSTEGNKNLLRLFILTDGVADPSSIPSPVDSFDGSFVIEYNIWDIQRMFEQENIMRGKSKVEIDFKVAYNTELPCIKIKDENPFVDAYLAIMPGVLLAKIYKQYHQALLERNVRSFLQFKGTVNKEIRKTMREHPSMFFSYNNGISSTADEVCTKNKEGRLCITRISNWQIVNGCQTTAAIAASINDRDVVMSKIYVPVKISVVRDIEHRDEIISAISKSANMQTAIKKSDFSSNDPYLVSLENYSREQYVPNTCHNAQTKWFFERTRGQYLDQQAQLTGANARYFKQVYPKNQKLTKTDVAKYETAWLQQPHLVCAGMEKKFAQFLKMVKQETQIISLAYYRNVISKCILFKTIDKMVRDSEFQGYKAPLTAYTLSSISFLSNKNLDLAYIWQHQRIHPKLEEKIKEIMPVVWSHLTSRQNPLQWSQTQECWRSFIEELRRFPTFGSNLLMQEVNDDGSSLNDAQQEVIEKASAIEAQTWFRMATWAMRRDVMSPLDRKTLYNLGYKAQRGKTLTLKEAQNALKLYNDAYEYGYKENSGKE